MKRMYMVTVMALVAGMSFPAMANIDLTVDFSVLPTTQGWTNISGGLGVDPDTQVDTGLKIWDMENPDGAHNSYRRTDHVSLQTGTPDFYHGRAVIDHQGTWGNFSDLNLVQFIDIPREIYVWLNPTDGGLSWYAGASWNHIVFPAGVSNSTGVHTYEWETAIGPGNATVTTDVWFDGVKIATGLDMKGVPGADRLSFGDGSTNSGANHHHWMSFHFGQGRIPEPATLTLLGLGSGLMLLRRRRWA